MQIPENGITILILITGLILVATTLIKLIPERISLPSVVGDILFGLFINYINVHLDFLTPGHLRRSTFSPV